MYKKRVGIDFKMYFSALKKLQANESVVICYCNNAR